MSLHKTRYRELRTWRATDDGHFFLYVCLERMPEGGFVCPYCAAYRNWQFMEHNMEDLQMRHKLFSEISNPQCKVFATVDEAIDAFDLTQVTET
jgi:hypothetical protein